MNGNDNIVTGDIVDATIFCTLDRATAAALVRNLTDKLSASDSDFDGSFRIDVTRDRVHMGAFVAADKAGTIATVDTTDHAVVSA